LTVVPYRVSASLFTAVVDTCVGPPPDHDWWSRRLLPPGPNDLF